MKYYVIRNKFNNVLGYGNTDKAITEDFKEQFHNDDDFEIIEVETVEPEQSNNEAIK